MSLFKSLFGNDFIIIFVSTLLSISCAVIKEPPRPDLIPVQKNEFKKLDATFSNYPTTATGKISLSPGSYDYKTEDFWNQIRALDFKGDEESFKTQTVTLEFISHRKAIAKLWHGDTLLKTKILRGRIKEGHFYRRPHLIIIPLFPLLCGFFSEPYRIGLTNDSIVVDTKWRFWQFALFAGNEGKGTSSSTFKKL